MDFQYSGEIWRDFPELVAGVVFAGGIAQDVSAGDRVAKFTGIANCPSRARGVRGRLPGPAADIEDVVAGSDADGPAQYLVVPPQFGVVAAGAGRVFACGVSHRDHFTTVSVVA